MAKRKYDAACVFGKYTDKNGESRQRWLPCGAVFENEKGLSLKLEALPVGIPEGGLWIKFFEPRQVQNGPTSAHEKKAPDPDGDIPW